MLIPAYNGHDNLERTFASLAETAPVYVLVVDDGRTPPIAPAPRAGLDVEVLRVAQQWHRALAGGRHRGASRAVSAMRPGSMPAT